MLLSLCRLVQFYKKLFDTLHIITFSRVEIPDIFFSIFFSFVGKQHCEVCPRLFFCGEVTFLCYSALWSTITFITEMTVPLAVVALVLLLVCLLLTVSFSFSRASASTAVILLLTILLFFSLVVISYKNVSATTTLIHSLSTKA